MIAHTLLTEKVVAVLRLQAHETPKVRRIAEALVAGGIPAIEITLNTPGALGLIEMLATEMGDTVLPGAGTVLDAASARMAMDAGARYLVSPVFKPEMIAMAHAYGCAAIPGCFTATECLAAQEAGADIVKVFPAHVDGPAYFRALLAPMPQLRLMPTRGVTPENAGEWLRAGAVCLGLGAALVDPTALAEDRFDAITERARMLRESLDAFAADG